jgi:hypothetical protein
MRLLCLLGTILLLAVSGGRGQLPGLTTDAQGDMLKDGRPFRAIGLNYFSCFIRTLKNPSDTSYDEEFGILAAHQIPFVRFSATGYWPRDMALYQTDRAEYFRRLDAVVASAERHGLGLVPSLFWSAACVPDLVGEPLDQWGNPRSKTHAWMREYVREVVTRYRDSPAIWAWEMGNEFSLQASLPNTADHRPAIHPGLGTATSRSERDDVTFAMVRVAFAEFAQAVRKHDSARLIFTGDSMPRPAAWHMQREGTWTQDNESQFREMIRHLTPDPANGISVHAYDDDIERLPWSIKAARILKKPLFVGEFGARGDGAGGAAVFRRYLKVIEDSDVPLAAVWVFDLPAKDNDYNITADNARAYQLREVGEANARIQAAQRGSRGQNQR